MSRVVSYSENRNWLASIAVFSDCGAYRYSLCRTWDRNLPAIMFLMLNPSTADEKANDPTIERCERRARAMGYGTLLVGNIFAYRSTDPGALYSHPAPEGKDNDAYLLESAKHAKTVICGWGTHGALHDRGERVRLLAAVFDGTLMSYRWCSECCAAMAASWTDDGRAWEARVRLGDESSNAALTGATPNGGASG